MPEAALATQDQIVARDASTVVLPDDVIKGLVPAQVSMMKETVANVECGFVVAGKALRSISYELRCLRENLPNRTWTKFTESGVLPISGKAARELEAAWDFINAMGLSNGALAHLSTRTLSKIANAHPDAQKQLIERTRRGEKITESMVRELNEAVTNSDLSADQKAKVKANVNAASKLKSKDAEIAKLKEELAKVKKEKAALEKQAKFTIDSVYKNLSDEQKKKLVMFKGDAVEVEA